MFPLVRWGAPRVDWQHGCDGDAPREAHCPDVCSWQCASHSAHRKALRNGRRGASEYAPDGDGSQSLGVSAPVRPAPRVHSAIREDMDQPLDARYIRENIKLFKDALGRITGLVRSQARRVDNYRPQFLSASGAAGEETLSTLILQPEFEFPEIIESIVVTGPPTVASSETLVSNPAAGASSVVVFTATVPTQLDTVSFQYVSDATVGNRTVRIQIQDATGNILAQVAGLTTLPASSTGNVYAFIGATNNGGASGTQVTALPNNFILQPGWKVLITATGTIGAADQIS